MRIILIGIPGAGKSTQGNLLSKRLKLPYLSAGHIFRQIAKEKSARGRYYKEVLHSGELLPDDKALPVIEEYLARKEYKRGYILDGFPRNIAQAKNFKENIDKVINIALPDKEALWRLAYRADNRDDQAAATIVHRLEVFHESTDPLIQHYREVGLLVDIDGTGSVEEVNEEILKNLGKEFIDNHLTKWDNKKKVILALTGLSGAGKSTVAKLLSEERDVPIFSLETVDIHKLRDAVKESHVAVLDDVESSDMFEKFKEDAHGMHVIVVHVWADKETRRKRMKDTDKQDQIDIEKKDVGKILSQADYLVDTSDASEEFDTQVERIFREVYFGLD